jgi:hypothetical protein
VPLLGDPFLKPARTTLPEDRAPVKSEDDSKAIRLSVAMLRSEGTRLKGVRFHRRTSKSTREDADGRLGPTGPSSGRARCPSGPWSEPVDYGVVAPMALAGTRRLACRPDLSTAYNHARHTWLHEEILCLKRAMG